MDKYLAYFAGSILTLLTGFILISVVINPYGYFSTPAIPGINDNKSELHRKNRISLAKQIVEQKPEHVLLGSSRVYHGFEYAHDASPLSYMKVGLQAANMYEQYRYYQHIKHQGRLSHIILGLDFIMFNHNRDTVSLFREDVLSVNADGSTNNWRSLSLWKQIIKTSLSLNGLISAARTVRDQTYIDKFAVRDMDAESIGLVRDIHRYGQRQSFLRLVSSYPSVNWCPEPYNTFSFGERDDPLTPLNLLRSLIRDAYQEGITVTLFISPVHAYLLEALAYAGLWPDFEQWKTGLVGMLQEEAKAAGQQPFALWDFTGYDRYTTDDVPPQGSGEIMLTFWEPSHFRPHLGEKVLERMFIGRDAENRDFGIKLSAQNIQRHLSNTRQLRKVYQQTHAKEVARIKRIGITPRLCGR